MMNMETRIINVYNNDALPHKDLKSAWGESFHITAGDSQILFDVGWKGDILKHNMKKLGIKPDEIDTLVFSHAHMDHTGGLPTFLKSRDVSTPLTILGHPAVKGPKGFWGGTGGGAWYYPGGLPNLPKQLRERYLFELTKKPAIVAPNLSTTGEITERPEKPGTLRWALHKTPERWEWDPILDDLSLILQTKNGMVLITGCCHAGLLNVCKKATALFNDRIRAIIGGTHMIAYSKEEIIHIGNVLETRYGSPELYLNHCTGKEAIALLKKHFGPDIVQDCHVGTELTFDG